MHCPLNLPVLATPTAAHQIHVGARLQQRIAGWIDAVDAWKRIENNVALFAVIVRNHRGQFDRPELNIGTRLRPVDGRVIDNVAGSGQLDRDVELHRTLRNPFLQSIEEEVGGLRG
jgi:hypothetical protein